MKNKKNYITRTLWTAIVALPFVAAYYIFGVIMLISRSINYARVYGQNDEILAIEKYRAVSRIMGIDGIGFALVMIVAVMFAFQGFSYMFNQSQMDFYLSQPTTRLQRIKKNYLNAFMTFILMFAGAELVALIIALGMRAVCGAVLLSVAVEFIRSVVLFFAVYNVTVLAIMLSGTYIAAALLTGLFAFAPIVGAGEIRLYKDIFFATYSSKEAFNVYLSPVFDRFYNLLSLQGLMSQNEYYAKGDLFNSVKLAAAEGLRYDIDVLVVAIIAFAAVLIISRYRKAEMAGTSIAFRPFRWIVKVAVSVLIGIGAGYFVYIIYDSVWTNRLFMLMCAIIVITTILTGCLVEVILDANIRRFFKGMPQTIIAVALSVLVFVIFKGDLLGFDTYIPSPERVESCALVDYDGSFYSWINGRNYFENIPEEYMYITDADSLVKMTELGMKTAREYRKDADYSKYERAESYSLTVLYRLKGGRKVYRRIVLPYGTDSDLMDSILSSEEYKTGNFAVFHDEILREEDELYSRTRVVTYYTVNGRKTTSSLPYSELSDAVRKDIFNSFSYEYMSQNLPVGVIDYSVGGRYFSSANISIYENFENTLALLKKYDIYSDGEINPSEVESVKVTNYYPGYDSEEDGYRNVPEYAESKTVTYESASEISQIFSSAVPSEYYNKWYDYSRNNNQYNIEVVTGSYRSEYDGGHNFVFLRGQVPDFVIKDTNN